MGIPGFWAIPWCELQLYFHSHLQRSTIFVQHSVYFPFLKSLFVCLQYSWGCVLVDHQNTQSNLGPIGNYVNIGRTNMLDMSFCVVCDVDIETIWNCGIRTIFDGVVLQSTRTRSAMLGPSCPFRDIARMSNINTKTTHPVQNLMPVSKMLVVVVYLQHWWTDRPCNTEHCTICEYVNIRARAHEGSCGLEGAL